MDALRRAFALLPIRNVRTFIASGNVIFDAALRDPASLEREAERTLREAFGFPIDTFVRSLEELERIADGGPFAEAAASGGTVYVGFLRAEPGPHAQRQVEALSTDVHEFRISRRELFWLRRDVPGARDAPVPPLDRVLTPPLTVRNARTVRRIVEKYR